MSEKKLAKVFYADLWGIRSEKYRYLQENDVTTTKWQELKPIVPYYFFIPKEFSLQEEYENFWKVTEIFREWGSGIITRRDTLTVAFQRNELQNRMLMFSNPNLPDSIIAETFKIGDTSEWNLSKARKEVKNERQNDLIKEYHYRPWDFRHVYYSDSVVSRACRRWMKHLLSENLALITTRVITDIEEKGSFVSSQIGDIHVISGQSYFFPLYLYPDQPKGRLFGEETSERKRIPNFTNEFLQAINESLGEEPAPEEIFYYIYAILFSPTYRKRYDEFLKIDFPRIPLPLKKEAFDELSDFGKELVELHLLKASALDETNVGFPKSGSNKVEKVRYDEKAQRVYINEGQCFEGISKEVWKYQIGAYQLMDKFLKDRKERKLSLEEIEHYMKVAKAINLTIEFQSKIDEIYESFCATGDVR